MDRVDVKALVQEAVGGEWDAFCARHPAIARVVSQDLMVEQFVDEVRKHPEFVQAMDAVNVDGMAQGVAQEAAARIVRGLMKVIVG